MSIWLDYIIWLFHFNPLTSFYSILISECKESTEEIKWNGRVFGVTKVHELYISLGKYFNETKEKVS